MADKNQHNDPIEEFFRKKTGEYEIGYREEDWFDLEKKLNLRDARRWYQKSLRRVIAAAVLILGLIGYFTYQNYDRINQIDQQLTEQPADPSPDSPAPEIPSIPESAEPEADDSSLRSQIAQDPDDTALTSADEVEAYSDQDPEQQPSDLVSQINEEYFMQNQLKNRRLQAETLRPEIEVLLVSDSYTTPPLYSTKAFVASASETSPYDMSPASADRVSSFSVGALFSPDISTVGSLSGFHEPGYKIGLSVEYTPWQNSSLSAGIVYTSLRYSARYSDYNPPVYWQEGSNPSRMIGECTMFDIPITFTWKFMNFDRSRIYTSAGLSSYVMLNETYMFSYDDYQPDALQEWSDRTGSFHLFSNATVSIGYELDMHQNWSLRAEPFIKLPLRDVGWGNVRLYSMGSFISLHYRL